jgi:hypothetical protein
MNFGRSLFHLVTDIMTLQVKVMLILKNVDSLNLTIHQ